MRLSSLGIVVSLPGGSELSLLPLMLVFYVAIPLALLYLVARRGDDDDGDSATAERE